jgi:hypothetical protein
MSLAVVSAMTSSDSRRPAPPPAFPRLARKAAPEPGPQRPRVEAPPAKDARYEEDPERWDGMS